MAYRIQEQEWPRAQAEARILQDQLREQVIAEDRFGVIRRVAGVDAHYGSDRIWAAIVVMKFPDLVVLESKLISCPVAFPYVPGLLAFREGPAMLGALGRLSRKADLLLVDGQGLAHPRRFGLACHLGMLADLPTIGVAKSRLVGVYEEPGSERGASSELVDNGQTIGIVLRTRNAVRPVFVSIGHRVSLKTAAAFVMRCTGRFRIPEPVRAADRLSRQGHLIERRLIAPGSRS